MNYKASWDNWTRAITTLTITIVAFAASRVIRDIVHSSGNTISNVLILALLASIILIAYLFSIREYTLTANQLIIKRPIGNIFINLSDINKVKMLDSASGRVNIRLFGNGGLFGFYGKYYGPELGTLTVYATKRNNRILITTATKGQIVITPDDISLYDKLVEVLTQQTI